MNVLNHYVRKWSESVFNRYLIWSWLIWTNFQFTLEFLNRQMFSIFLSQRCDSNNDHLCNKWSFLIHNLSHLLKDLWEYTSFSYKSTLHKANLKELLLPLFRLSWSSHSCNYTDQSLSKINSNLAWSLLRIKREAKSF